MPARSREVGELGSEVAQILSEARDRSGLSLRAVEDASGVGFTQIQKMLKGVKVITLDELGSICDALGLDPVEVLREAQARARERERADVIQLGERQRAWSEELPPLEELAAQVEPGADEELAETTGWRDDLGEESQDIPYGEDESL
ncbi:helix-turn-helix transcriptional regulator [Actinomyces sp. MRS3W]|uniref:helix-turn-helix domain-containing protein n=1 Tax=Actinomyces sp. MRS3W TaxID=2800796 RepID=UPI0028FD9161|nr:helix-turn-helix transcriptional regulator [Actinomyces sp. MRS3W]MDU0348325.1 helix-turn-helix transcriptional regulator [Actinomyces sp. MRS3W]